MEHWFSDLPAFRHDPLGFLMQRGSTATGPFVPLRLAPFPVYLVTDPDLVKPIMKMSEAEIDKGRLIHKLRAIVGKSSLTTSGPGQQERRAALHAQMARGIASSYVPQISALVRGTFAHLLCEEQFDAHRVSAALALRVIANALFGEGVLSKGDETALLHAVKLVEDDLAEGMFRLGPPAPWTWLRNRQRLHAARTIMSAVVQRTRKKAAASSLLASLNGLGLSDRDLEDEVLMILLAGHHTTGSAAAWLLYHIAADPNLAQSLAQEAKRCMDRGGELRASELPTASISLGVVREVLRLYPSAWWFSREVKARRVEIAGHTFRRGTSLLISPWHMHRDVRFWPEPERFDGARPSTSRAYLPFGAGPRACVGLGMAMLELQVIALELAATFNTELRMSMPPGLPRPSITLVPPSIPLALKPRSLGALEVAAE
ncbi:cytochrome P450 [Ancylobacter sp. FA202]|uniref:cytochrome P450 n=1 Tax=Ancylobacter sp. FA202 TaxID=1111106 RepID=UPI000373381C|nr:cytochrome P450 [Ancylobacter sp. FA202]